MQRRNLPTAVFPLLSCLAIGSFSFPLACDAVEAPPSTSVQYSDPHVHRERMTPVYLYARKTSDVIIGSTPLEQGDLWSKMPKRTAIAFEVSKEGQFSNWRFKELSGSLSRDFWTLYAVSSCPRVPVTEEIETPLSTSVSNYRLRLESSDESLNWRIEQGWGICRKSNAKNIFFCLIPASFIRQLPDTVSIEQVVTRNNLVGIPVDRLCSKGQSNWSLTHANELITTKNEISEFLNEWPTFLKKNPQPSAAQINTCADEIKRKYKNLLVLEGEPEAPLP
jgi:hypothetical protein